jgi:hypothetical protein
MPTVPSIKKFFLTKKFLDNQKKAVLLLHNTAVKRTIRVRTMLVTLLLTVAALR